MYKYIYIHIYICMYQKLRARYRKRSVSPWIPRGSPWDPLGTLDLSAKNTSVELFSPFYSFVLILLFVSTI